MRVCLSLNREAVVAGAIVTRGRCKDEHGVYVAKHKGELYVAYRAFIPVKPLLSARTIGLIPTECVLVRDQLPEVHDGGHRR